MPLHQGHREPDERPLAVNPFYAQADPAVEMTEAPPKHRLGHAPLTPATAYQLVHDELMPDGNCRLNLATFVTTSYDVFDVSRRLRENGRLVPAHTFPPNREDLSVLRVVCRNGFSADLAGMSAAVSGRPPGAAPPSRTGSPGPRPGRR